jgi:hypothetical protein
MGRAWLMSRVATAASLAQQQTTTPCHSPEKGWGTETCMGERRSCGCRAGQAEGEGLLTVGGGCSLREGEGLLTAGGGGVAFCGKGLLTAGGRGVAYCGLGRRWCFGELQHMPSLANLAIRAWEQLKEMGVAMVFRPLISNFSHFWPQHTEFLPNTDTSHPFVTL